MNAPLLLSLIAVTTASTLFAAFAPAPRSAAVEPFRVIQTTNYTIPDTPETLEHPWGEATVMVNVDAQGQLVDLLVIRSTHDIYARAAEEALREWRFEPARENGEPVGTRQQVKLTFEARGVAVTMSAGTTLSRLASQTGMVIRSREHLASAHQLDTPLRALQTVAPLSPAPDVQVPGTASVTLDFIVDAQGRPRMPVVLTTPNEVYAAAAVDALEQWQFAPPTRAGRPVAVRVQQQFVFEPDGS